MGFLEGPFCRKKVNGKHFQKVLEAYLCTFEHTYRRIETTQDLGASCIVCTELSRYVYI